MIILFLNENPLPAKFTRGTIAGKELRLRAALPSITQIHVISRRGKSPDVSDLRVGELEAKIHIHLLPPWPYYLAALPLFISGLYWCLKLKPASIEAESPIISGPATVLLGKLIRCPSIVEVRASYDQLIDHHLTFIPRQLKAIVLNLVMFNTLKHANAVIANSQYYQKQLKAKNIASTVINPGLQYLDPLPAKATGSASGRIGSLDEATVAKEGQPSTLTPRHFYPEQSRGTTLTLGYLGRLVPEKGVHLLIEAFKLLSTQSSTLDHLPAKATGSANGRIGSLAGAAVAKEGQPSLLIAGDGPEKETLQKQILKSELSSHISLVGFQKNTTFLNKVDILINPNLVNHPLEMANAEAAAFGIPVICFGDKHQPETVIDGVTGIKVKQKSPEALAAAIVQLIKQPEKRQQLSLQAQQFAKENYQFDRQCHQLHQLYENLNVMKPATNFRVSAPESDKSPTLPVPSSKKAPR